MCIPMGKKTSIGVQPQIFGFQPGVRREMAVQSMSTRQVSAPFIL